MMAVLQKLLLLFSPHGADLRLYSTSVGEVSISIAEEGPIEPGKV